MKYQEARDRAGYQPKNRRNARRPEKIIEGMLLLSALAAIIVVLLISAFIFKEGAPVLAKVGVRDFILGQKWAPTEGAFGILPMIVGSLLVTFGALILGVPLGIACAIFLAEIAPPRVARLVRPVIELLAGIPSVVYGFFGLVVLVPLIRDYLGGAGFSILAGSVILAVMILPTVINISEDAIRAVPKEYKEGSLALGTTHGQTIGSVILPAARSGIIAAVVLGMGRAIGETMAVIMVTGNATRLPGADLPNGLLKPLQMLLEPVRTLTSNVALEMGYASGEHTQALFATGIVLFVMIMLLSILAGWAARGQVSRR
ncbi:MAG: phosphate ABC transporter permease subunit PstC [Syntrophothermus sp.]